MHSATFARPRGSAYSAAPPLIDACGRVQRDLRISVTDRCNLHCTYSMPAGGLAWLPGSRSSASRRSSASPARLLVERHGFESIRLTGGEPTVGANLPDLVARLAALGIDLALTTNGLC